MEDRYMKRCKQILESPYRDELIIGMMKDLHMFNNQDRFITSVIEDKTMDSETKVKVITKFI
jgi:hypothetical protein